MISTKGEYFHQECLWLGGLKYHRYKILITPENYQQCIYFSEEKCMFKCIIHSFNCLYFPLDTYLFRIFPLSQGIYHWSYAYCLRVWYPVFGKCPEGTRKMALMSASVTPQYQRQAKLMITVKETAKHSPRDLKFTFSEHTPYRIASLNTTAS